ncbi:hypothetical protein IMSAGC008_02371 [Muribaculaceae bacterium]|nr:hypothetical protein IMSAGC008_02371 [Muribaculaceae bacterium]
MSGKISSKVNTRDGRCSLNCSIKNCAIGCDTCVLKSTRQRLSRSSIIVLSAPKKSRSNDTAIRSLTALAAASEGADRKSPTSVR